MPKKTLRQIAEMYRADVLDRIETIKDENEWNLDSEDVQDQLAHWGTTLHMINEALNGYNRGR